MTLKDLLKLRRHYPLSSQIELKVNNQVFTSFDLSFHFSSEGKWVITINPKIDNLFNLFYN